MLQTSLKLVPGRIEFSGPNTLPQFEVGSVKFETGSDSNQLAAKMVVHRIVSYHVTNTFIPTMR